MKFMYEKTKKIVRPLVSFIRRKKDLTYTRDLFGSD